MRWIDRPEASENHYIAEREDGQRFSVVNIGGLLAGTMMTGFGFQGWEAIPIDKDGELMSDWMLREDSREELDKVMEVFSVEK